MCSAVPARERSPSCCTRHCEEGYTGFLTLEPHLVLFDSLQSLETTDAKNIIRENKYKNGAEGYAAQYHALCDILAKF